VKWFDDEQEPSPVLKALQEVRRMATREGWRYQHIQAIIVASTNMRKPRPAFAISFRTSRPVRGALRCCDSPAAHHGICAIA
jgi:hypothetical protein